MKFFDSVIKCVKKTLDTVAEETPTNNVVEKKNVHPAPSSRPKSKPAKPTGKKKNSGWSVSDAVDDIMDIF